jgi:anti-anti-sigma regulatory factor
VYFDDDGCADAVLERLVDDRVPVLRPLADGQLTVVDAELTRAALRGPVDVAAGLVVDMIGGAVEAGYSGFRMTGQFSSGLVRSDGISLTDYDAALDALLVGHPARTLCFYDRRHYPEEAIERMRTLHEVEVNAPALYDDNLLRVTRPGRYHLRLAGEVDHSNRPVLARLLASTLDDALRSHDSPDRIEVDLSSLRFLDVAGAVALVHAAEGFPESHRLALTGARPGVLRVLDRCGAPFAAQLEVSAHPGPGLPAAAGPGR